METVQSVDTSLRRLLLSSTLVLTSVSLFAQSVSVKGTVTDPAGEPIIGATVLEKGTTNGTMTDAKGHFVLKAKNPKATIRVSYVGYKPLEIALDGRREIKVVLTEEAATLNEVVVVGYGTMGKKELTSAVTHVSSKNFSQMATVDPSMMIQGKVAGVSITNTGAGDPNNQASIQVRGVSSRAAGLGPLIVIDGVPGGNLTNLNPNDIESFDILKDGAASAIYGTRGSNGVILVTTKKGARDGNLHTTYTGTVSFDVIKRELDMLSADEYRANRLASGVGYDLGGSVDWLDAVSASGHVPSTRSASAVVVLARTIVCRLTTAALMVSISIRGVRNMVRVSH